MFLMDIFASNLRKRAEELGISNAEAARRIGLGERRYGNYVTGRREPDLATLVRIAKILETTPNILLGVGAEIDQTERTILRDRMNSAMSSMGDDTLKLITVQAEALIKAGVKL